MSLSPVLLFPTRVLLSLRRAVARVALWVAAVASALAFVAWAVALLVRRGPRATFSWRRRERAPRALRDRVFGEHRYLRLKSSGLLLHFVTRGPPEAPLVLLLHGFPQNWFCWRHLMAELCPQFRVVAPDLRGCGDTEKPPGRDSYRLELLLGDIRDVIEALGTRGDGDVPKCVLVGHDWGAVLAWEVAARHPELVTSLVAISGPQRGVLAGFSACHPSQLLRSSYMFLFQLPWLPELLLALGDYELLRTFLTGPLTGVQDPSRKLSEPELDAYLFSLSQPGGLSPPLNYYRNAFGPPPVPREPPPPPTLLLWGSRDAFLDPRLGPAHLRWLRPPARLRLLPGASHWLPEERPRLLAKLIGEFLGGGAGEGS